MTREHCPHYQRVYISNNIIVVAYTWNLFTMAIINNILSLWWLLCKSSTVYKNETFTNCFICFIHFICQDIQFSKATVVCTYWIRCQWSYIVAVPPQGLSDVPGLNAVRTDLLKGWGWTLQEQILFSDECNMGSMDSIGCTKPCHVQFCFICKNQLLNSYLILGFYLTQT